MATNDHELLDLVGPLDPARAEHPPVPGSDRYHSILEFAMHTDTDTPPIDSVAPSPRTPIRPRWQRIIALFAATAAATLIAVGAFVVVQSDDAPTAEAAVSSAADSMETIASLEGELTVSVPGLSEGATRIRVNGDDLAITGETRFADGHTEATAFIVVDGTGYMTIDGRTTTTPVGPGDGLAPFGPSSAAVIAAALEGSEVTERGDEVLGGITTTRYDIQLTDASVAALAALSPGELAWFELEYPDAVKTLSVWVADDLVHQVEIAQRDQTSRTRLFNFGEEQTITAPPGPYEPATDE